MILRSHCFCWGDDLLFTAPMRCKLPDRNRIVKLLALRHSSVTYKLKQKQTVEILVTNKPKNLK